MNFTLRIQLDPRHGRGIHHALSARSMHEFARKRVAAVFTNVFFLTGRFRVFCFPDARYLNCQRVTYPCNTCGKIYNYYSSLARHLKHECGVEPKFHCPLCPYKTKHKSSLNTHLNGRHMKLLNDLYTTPNGNKMSSTDTGHWIVFVCWWYSNNKHHMCASYSK